MSHSVGKREDKIKYLDGINEKIFVNLVSDILYFELKHRDIKIMDGTGDGKRDILSINKYEKKCLTQCKFHHDLSKCSGSNETDEVVMGLLKFGYKTGNFATSGRLSPQAKREYENDYPDYDLDYFDGERIVDYILDNPVLSSYWINGNSIDQSMKSLAIPILVRGCVVNLDEFFKVCLDDFKLNKKNNVSFKIESGVFSKDFFEPYQELTIKNKYEGWNPNLICHKITVSGGIELNQIPQYKQQILEELNRIKSKIGLDMISVRFGKMQIVNSNINSNYLKIPINVETYKLGTEIVKESEWVIGLDSNYSIPIRLSTSQADFFRFYSVEHDTCTNLLYLGDIRLQDRSMFVEKNEFEKLIWNNSFFLTGRDDVIDSLCGEKNLNPDIKLKYGSADAVVGWIYPTSQFRPVLSGDRQTDYESIKKESFEYDISLLKDYIIGKEVSILHPNVAFHVARINDYEPYSNDVSKCVYRMADLSEYFVDIPSPINLHERRIIITKVWTIGTINVQDKDKHITSIDAISKKMKFTYETFTRCDLSYSNVGSGKKFYILVDVSSNNIGDVRSIEYINHFELKAKEHFDNFETELLKLIPDSHSCTREYWLNEYGIIFGDTQ